MHRLIRDRAGHHLIADAMSHVDYEDYDLARLETERRAAAKSSCFVCCAVFVRLRLLPGISRAPRGWRWSACSLAKQPVIRIF